MYHLHKFKMYQCIPKIILHLKQILWTFCWSKFCFNQWNNSCVLFPGAFLNYIIYLYVHMTITFSRNFTICSWYNGKSNYNYMHLLLLRHLHYTSIIYPNHFKCGGLMDTSLRLTFYVMLNKFSFHSIDHEYSSFKIHLQKKMLDSLFKV